MDASSTQRVALYVRIQKTSRPRWNDVGQYQFERLHGWTPRIYKIPYTQTGIDQHRSNAVGLFFVFEHTRLRVELKKRPSKPDMCVRDLLKIRRGISTGCNEFFVLTDEKARQSKIPRQYLRRVLPTRIPLPGRNFSEADWNLLRE